MKTSFISHQLGPPFSLFMMLSPLGPPSTSWGENLMKSERGEPDQWLMIFLSRISLQLTSVAHAFLSLYLKINEKKITLNS